MPANMKRMLPILLVMVVVLFIVPQLVGKKKSTGPKADARATQTIDAMNLVEKGQLAFMTANGAFTAHIADLIKPGSKLAEYLATGVTVSIDAGTDGNASRDEHAHADGHSNADPDELARFAAATGSSPLGDAADGT